MDEDQDNSEEDKQIDQFTEPSELQNYNCEDNSPVEGSSHREEQTELGANEQDKIVASKKKLKFDENLLCKTEVTTKEASMIAPTSLLKIKPSQITSVKTKKQKVQVTGL